jgi:3-methyl-2-oxobutanoate hydroxymethyltransferase
MNTRRTILDLYAAKQAGRKIVAISCYDFTTARLVAQSDVDMILVGDSAAQLLLGHESTLPATMDFMVMITAAVGRGAPETCLVADMPFMSYQTGIRDALRNAARFVTDAGAQIVKFEVTDAYLDVVRAVSNAGIAVMAHIGIRPQSISKLGRLRAEGTTAKLAFGLVRSAQNMIEAGASALLIEGTASEVSELITQLVDVPVISCGSGVGCDGQVLVAPDILGLSPGKKPKFSKSFGNLADQTVSAIGAYGLSVRDESFPDDQHCYHMKPGEMDKLKKLLEMP